MVSTFFFWFQCRAKPCTNANILTAFHTIDPSWNFNLRKEQWVKIFIENTHSYFVPTYLCKKIATCHMVVCWNTERHRPKVYNFAYEILQKSLSWLWSPSSCSNSNLESIQELGISFFSLKNNPSMEEGRSRRKEIHDYKISRDRCLLQTSEEELNKNY